MGTDESGSVSFVCPHSSAMNLGVRIEPDPNGAGLTIGGLLLTEVGWACCPSRAMRDSTRADNMSTLRKLIPCHSSLTPGTFLGGVDLSGVLVSQFTKLISKLEEKDFD